MFWFKGYEGIHGGRVPEPSVLVAVIMAPGSLLRLLRDWVVAGGPLPQARFQSETQMPKGMVLTWMVAIHSVWLDTSCTRLRK